jgi:hypothetical protein
MYPDDVWMDVEISFVLHARLQRPTDRANLTSAGTRAPRAPGNLPMALGGVDRHTQPVYGLCMATKTISIETDAYELLAREKQDSRESFSRVIRRLFAERPALTAGDLLDGMESFKGKGAGPRRKRS